MTGIFIAATGTDLGKTHLCAQLLQRGQQDKQPFWISKPIISGWPVDQARIATTDTAILLQAAGLPIDEAHIQAISPWRFVLPQTPDMAAKAAMVALCQTETAVLECHGVAGEDCYVLKVRVHDPKELEALLDRLRSQVPIARSVTNIVMSTHKETLQVEPEEINK